MSKNIHFPSVVHVKIFCVGTCCPGAIDRLIVFSHRRTHVHTRTVHTYTHIMHSKSITIHNNNNNILSSARTRIVWHGLLDNNAHTEYVYLYVDNAIVEADTIYYIISSRRTDCQSRKITISHRVEFPSIFLDYSAWSKVYTLKFYVVVIYHCYFIHLSAIWSRFKFVTRVTVKRTSE